jgi:hypothetical protein
LRGEVARIMGELGRVQRSDPCDVVPHFSRPASASSLRKCFRVTIDLT